MNQPKIIHNRYDKITPLARRLAKLADTDEFIKEFERLRPMCRTYKEAYMLTEMQHYRLFERPKYASFKSFETVYRRKKGAEDQ